MSCREDATNECEFGQDNSLSRNAGPTAKLKGSTYFQRGPRDFFPVHTTLKLHFKATGTNGTLFGRHCSLPPTNTWMSMQS